MLRRCGLAAFVALALFGASCGDDSDSSADSGPSTAAGAGDSTTSVAVSTSAPVDTSSTSAATSSTLGPLTASHRGVTEDTITIGYPPIDFQGLRDQFGLTLTYANFEPAMRALVGDLNQRGGINGRTIELITAPFVPSGPAAADGSCLKLTEDNEVFAVLGGYAGPSEPVNTCITADHETILIGTPPNAEQRAQAKAPWITTIMSPLRSAAGYVAGLDGQGLLEELGDFAIYDTSGDNAEVVEVFKQALADAGTRVAFDDVVSDVADEVQSRSETDVFVERARSEGVGTILIVGESPFIDQQMVEVAGPEFNLLWQNHGPLSGWISDPPPGLENTKLVLGPNTVESTVDDPFWDGCREIVEEAYGAPVVHVNDLAEDETNYWAALFGTCQQIRLFETITTAAGAELNHETFLAAAEQLEDYPMPGGVTGSLGPGKYDLNDTLLLRKWDHATQNWVTEGEPFTVE